VVAVVAAVGNTADSSDAAACGANGASRSSTSRHARRSIRMAGGGVRDSGRPMVLGVAVGTEPPPPLCQLCADAVVPGVAENP